SGSIRRSPGRTARTLRRSSCTAWSRNPCGHTPIAAADRTPSPRLPRLAPRISLPTSLPFPPHRRAVHNQRPREREAPPRQVILRLTTRSSLLYSATLLTFPSSRCLIGWVAAKKRESGRREFARAE